MANADSNELLAFHRYCELRRITAIDIEERQPPEPDVLASVEGSWVAYELTEAVEPEYARKLSDMSKTAPLIRAKYGELPKERRDRIEAPHGGKVIDICFHTDVTLRDRERLLTDVFSFIADVPAARGSDELEWIETPFEQLDHIGMKQIRWDGIHWEPGAPAGWIDPQSALQARLNDKMGNKQYETEHPIELIVYLDREVSPPENTGWEDDLASLAEGQLKASPFRAAWLMNCWTKSVRQLA